jgi:predicted nucleic acid-binding protein
MVVLDTNVLSELVKPKPNAGVLRRLLAAPSGTYRASELTRFELRFGALLHPQPERLWARIQALILPVPTWLPVDAAISERAAIIAAQLRRKGRPVGSLADPIIAATALEAGLPLVTHNVRHFEAIDDLLVEDWFVETS